MIYKRAFDSMTRTSTRLSHRTSESTCKQRHFGAKNLIRSLFEYEALQKCWRVK